MDREILIQADDRDNRIAVLEDGKLMEIYFDRHQGHVGNIVKGRVINIRPGIQAAFVDIGIERNAFLHSGDVLSSRGRENKNSRPINIDQLLRHGQEIIVQVTKEPLGEKGARLTTQVSLPGRYVVYIPNLNYIGVSRKITGDVERERLRELVGTLKPKNTGIIVRTVAEGISAGELERDIKYLDDLWQGILEKSKGLPAPAVLHREKDLVGRVVRDLFSDEVDRLKVNSRDIYEDICGMLSKSGMFLKNRIFLYENEDLFHRHDIPHQIMDALKHRVWLNCGGYLIIEHMEALTAIDVNTGKYTGKRDLEKTITRTNMEAAVEIARQLRLRNIGGIIIIDFIDMDKDASRQKVISLLAEELKKDKTRTKILGITKLGLVEMTRKKVYQDLEEVLLQKCPYCDGKGKVLSKETMALNARRRIISRSTNRKAPGHLIRLHPDVAAKLTRSHDKGLQDLMDKTGKKIIVQEDEELHMEEIEMEDFWPSMDNDSKDESKING